MSENCTLSDLISKNQFAELQSPELSSDVIIRVVIFLNLYGFSQSDWAGDFRPKHWKRDLPIAEAVKSLPIPDSFFARQNALWDEFADLESLAKHNMSAWKFLTLICKCDPNRIIDKLFQNMLHKERSTHFIFLKATYALDHLHKILAPKGAINHGAMIPCNLEELCEAITVGGDNFTITSKEELSSFIKFLNEDTKTLEKLALYIPKGTVNFGQSFCIADYLKGDKNFEVVFCNWAADLLGVKYILDDDNDDDLSDSDDDADGIVGSGDCV